MTPNPLDLQVAALEGIQLTQDGYIETVHDHLHSDFELYSPTTIWAQGGPIIEREKITVGACWSEGKPRTNPYDACHASIPFIDGKLCYIKEYGSTPLEAAMKCYVASKASLLPDQDVLK